MSLSRGELDSMIAKVKMEQEQSQATNKTSPGGRLLNVIHETVKLHGPLRLFVSIFTLPFTFFMGVVLVKEGKADQVPKLLRYGEG